MKKYTIHHVSKKMVMAGDITLPAPFPGNTPTRVMWYVIWCNRKRWQYLGKPSQNSYNRFIKLCSHPLTTAYFLREFDRKAVIGEAIDRTRAPGRVNFVRRSIRLTYYYRPTEPNRAIPGVTKLYPQKINGHWVSTSMAKMDLGSINQYVRWLKDSLLA